MAQGLGLGVMLKNTVLRLILVSAISLFYSSVTLAQDDETESGSVTARLDVSTEKVAASASNDEAAENDAGTEGNEAPVDKNAEKKVEQKEPKFFRKLKEESKTEIKTRLFGYYMFTDREGVQNQFVLDTARLNFIAKQGRFLEAVLKYDFSNTVNGHDVEDGVRDAYVRVEPVRAFGVQMGQFKKPFGGLELTSRGKLPSITRGEANDYVEFLHYGGRDVGAMISGRLIKKIDLNYYAGIFNGDGPGNPDLVTPSLDYAFRLESEPLKWLEVGVAASAHAIRKEEIAEVDKDFTPGTPEDYAWISGRHWMGELDIKFDVGNFEAIIETTLGQNWWFKESPYLWSLAAVLNYKFPLFGGAMAIEPVLFAEMLDIEDENWAWRVRLMQLAPGLNVHFGDNVRLMIHGQLAKTIGKESDFYDSELDDVIIETDLDWPGGWPGEFTGYKNLFIQLAFAN